MIAKRITSIALALMVAFTFMPAMTGTAHAAVKKPAKVTGLKAKSTKVSVTFTWKKAKNAKKYEVWQLKGKKYKKVKTVKVRKAVIKKLWPGTKYKFKVRAINGKKKGKFSAVKTFKTKKSTLHKKPITNPTKKDIKNMIPGDTYVIKDNSGAEIKITITKTEGYVEGVTSEGGTVEFTDTGGFNINNDPNEKYVEHNLGFDNDVVSDTYIVKIKADNVAVCWTVDGTEPKMEQADKFGKSPYVHFNDKDFETQLRGTFTKKGAHSFLTGDWLLGGKRCVWVKVYRNNKLMSDRKLIPY